MEAGLNLYSLHKLVKTEDDLKELALKLKAMGYTYLQVSGLPLSAEQIARALAPSGLPVYLTHSGLSDILENTQKVIDFNEALGCKNIGLGALPSEIIADEKECKTVIEKLNAVAQTLKNKGYTFFFHNHHCEFVKYNGQTVYDYMIENAPDIHFIADIYWFQYGGVSITEYLKKMNGRVECIHLKDYKLVAGENSANAFVPRFAPVGSGTINMRSVVDAALASGAKYFFVEQDDAWSYPDPLAQVESSIRFINNTL